MGGNKVDSLAVKPPATTLVYLYTRLGGLVELTYILRASQLLVYPDSYV
jgi:hypothetical protein